MANSPLFYHVVQHVHHGYRLVLCEPLALQPLDELERVEVVVPTSGRRGVE